MNTDYTHVRFGLGSDGRLRKWRFKSSNSAGVPAKHPPVEMTILGEKRYKVKNFYQQFYFTFKKHSKTGGQHYVIIISSCKELATAKATSEYEDDWEFCYDDYQHISDRNLLLLKEHKKA